MHIALLGSTGHVAKAIMGYLRKHVDLTHVARNPSGVIAHLEATGGGHLERQRTVTFERFADDPTRFDAIINCVGFGVPDKVAVAGLEVYRLTEKMDELCLNLLVRNPSTIYVNFSSGAVYGTSHAGPIGPDATFSMDLNQSRDSDHYRLAKLCSERKHRCQKNAHIVDIRLFSFFSEFIDLTSSYLICDIVRSIRDNMPLITGNGDIIRDYIHPSDLSDLILKIVGIPGKNIAVDAFSCLPFSKLALLEKVTEKFGLKVTMATGDIHQSPTGIKNYYFSNNFSATTEFGYQPKWNSQDAIIEGIKLCLKK